MGGVDEGWGGFEEVDGGGRGGGIGGTVVRFEGARAGLGLYDR